MGIIISFLLIGGFLFFTKIGRFIRHRTKGTALEVVRKDAATVQGATAYYSSLIDQREKLYKDALRTDQRMIGKIKSYKDEIAHLTKENAEIDSGAETLIQRGAEQDARIILQKQASNMDKIKLLSLWMYLLGHKNLTEIELQDCHATKKGFSFMRPDINSINNRRSVQARCLNRICLSRPNILILDHRNMQEAETIFGTHLALYPRKDIANISEVSKIHWEEFRSTLKTPGEECLDSYDKFCETLRWMKHQVSSQTEIGIRINQTLNQEDSLITWIQLNTGYSYYDIADVMHTMLMGNHHKEGKRR